MQSIFAIGFMALMVTAAAADDQPLTFPARDVAVQMQTNTPAGTVQVMQTFYLASEKKSRTAISGPDMYLLMDYKAQIVFTIYPGKPPTYITMPMPEDEKIKYLRSEQIARIAGYDCIVWQSPVIVRKSPAAGYPGMAPTYSYRATQCITHDGVTLRSIVDTDFQGSRTRTVSEATRVSYEAQKSVFVPIAGGRSSQIDGSITQYRAVKIRSIDAPGNIISSQMNAWARRVPCLSIPYAAYAKGDQFTAMAPLAQELART